MKNLFFTLSCFLFLNTFCFCQDILILKNGDEKNVKILEVSDTEVKYKKSDSSSVIYSKKKENIFMIKYHDGTKEVMTLQDSLKTKSVLKTPLVNSFDDCLQGTQDAKTNYTPPFMVGFGSFITAALFPIVGLIPTIACASTKPNPDSYNMPISKRNTEEYVSCYAKQAKRKKQGAAWLGWSLGTVCSTTILLIYNSLPASQK